MKEEALHGIRPRRVPVDGSIQIMQGDLVAVTRVQDLSATGLRVEMPREWRGQEGPNYILDLFLDNDRHIHLKAALKRIQPDALGFEYQEIPDESQAVLWEILGENAFVKERFR